MPAFDIDGDSGAIRSRTASMRAKGKTFVDTGDALAKISTSGWTGRAADAFADKFEAEPDRWRKAGDGFVDAASALEAYADALDDAKRRASWAKDEYARGEQETESARTAYDADVSRARQEVSDAAAQGTHMPLTILPFQDPGNSIRKAALDELSSAKADLEKAAHLAADGVRAGATHAPEKRKWYEKIGAAVGGFLVGAGEAVWDLLTMSSFSPLNMVADCFQLSTGDMTPEELAAKYRMSVESVGDMLDAFKEDPAEFGKQLGKGLLDWDTWADDPARALGHLVPDAVAAFFTAGVGAAATRGVKGGADAVDALSDLSTGTRGLDDLSDLSKGDDLGDLGKLDDLADGPTLPLGDTPGFTPDGHIDPQAFHTDPDTAFFWSGRTDGVGGQHIAGEFAENGSGTTLEQLMERRGVKMPEWDADNPAVVETWSKASAAYADEASGTVRAVVGDELRPGNVWETSELPALIDNPAIDKIIRIDPATGAETQIWP